VAAPAYNEAEGIDNVVRGWIDYLENTLRIPEFEIVICNDGSADSTGNILDKLAADYPQVKPLHFARNQGGAAAMTAAIRHTTLPWVLMIDSDGQYGIDSLHKMISAVEETGSRAATAVRIVKRDNLFTRLGSWMSGALCNAFHGTHYRDFNCSLKLVDGPLLRSLTLEAKGLNYSTEVMSKLIERRIRMAEVEVMHQPRSTGRSSATLRAAMQRILFVAYIGVRQFLFHNQVLQKESSCN